MNRLATSTACLLARRSSSSSSIAAAGRRRTISSTAKTPSTTAGLGGGGGGQKKKRGLFDRSVKEHYLENKKALDGVGLSFLFFYLSGHAFMQKQRADELAEELAVLQTEKKNLEHNLKDEKWTKEVAMKLGAKEKDAGRLRDEISARIRWNAGDLSTEDLGRSTGTATDKKDAMF